MTVDEAKHKMDYLKKAYQKLIDEKVDSGKLIGDGVMGEWKAETPIDEAYKSMIEALEIASKALEQPKTGHWIVLSYGFSPYGCSECGAVEFSKSNYCPKCGTKMIESEKKHEN